MLSVQEAVFLGKNGVKMINALHVSLVEMEIKQAKNALDTLHNLHKPSILLTAHTLQLSVLCQESVSL